MCSSLGEDGEVDTAQTVRVHAASIQIQSVEITEQQLCDGKPIILSTLYLILTGAVLILQVSLEVKVEQNTSRNIFEN